MILLPLNPNKRCIENQLHKFHEKMKLYDPLQFVDLDMAKNIAKIEKGDYRADLKQGFMASYLHSLPFLGRLRIDTITRLLSA